MDITRSSTQSFSTNMPWASTDYVSEWAQIADAHGLSYFKTNDRDCTAACQFDTPLGTYTVSYYFNESHAMVYQGAIGSTQKALWSGHYKLGVNMGELIGSVEEIIHIAIHHVLNMDKPCTQEKE